LGAQGRHLVFIGSPDRCRIEIGRRPSEPRLEEELDLLTFARQVGMERGAQDSVRFRKRVSREKGWERRYRR